MAKSLEDQFQQILGQYKGELEETVITTQWRVAGDARKEVIRTSDVETNSFWAHGKYDSPSARDKATGHFATRSSHGKYKKGWQRKRENRGTLIQTTTVHNTTDWSLTHLLAKGHALRVGGRSHPIARNRVSAKQSKGIYGIKDRYEGTHGIYVTSLTREIEKIK